LVLNGKIETMRRKETGGKKKRIKVHVHSGRQKRSTKVRTKEAIEKSYTAGG